MTDFAQSLEHFKHRRVVALHLETSIEDAAKTLCEENVGCILVTDSQEHVVGILTDRDIVCSAVALHREMDTAISEIMTPQPVFAEETDHIARIALLMEENGIRRIPIVKRTGPDQSMILGIITLDDLIAARLLDFDSISRIVTNQQVRGRERKIAAAGTTPRTTLYHPHPERSLNHFYKVVANKTLIPSEQLLAITHDLLGSLIRRLHYTGAARFTAQLPPELREELLDMPAGPDRSITVGKLVEQLINRYKLEEPKARAIIFNFFAALEELIPEKEIEQIKTQLPEEFRALFIGAPKAGGEKGRVA
jgi:CBS domain-containing protein/uncharacterized protein (DUF2267 family)